jgi:hypothetical protein
MPFEEQEQYRDDYHLGETEGVVNPLSRHEGPNEKCPNCGEEMAFMDQGFRQYNRCKVCGTETDAKENSKENDEVNLGLLNEGRVVNFDIEGEYPAKLNPAETFNIEHIISEVDLKKVAPGLTIEEFLAMSPGQQDEIERQIKEL